MEDFPVMLLFLIIYLIAASSGNKKQKRKKSSMRTRSQGEQRDMRAANRDRQTKAGFEEVFAQSQKAEPGAQQRCDMRQMHLHEVAPKQIDCAEEGEDPCHIGGQTLRDEAPFEVLQTQEGDMFAQDVLRGVVMSEILLRPHERAAMRRGRR